MKSLAVLSLINRVRALKRRPLVSLSVAKAVAKRQRYISNNNPLYLGTHIMPFTVVANERDPERDYYDESEQ